MVLRRKKGKRLPSQRVPNDLEQVRDTLKAFLANPTMRVGNKPEFQKASEIDFSDEKLELIAEAYLDEKEISAGELNTEIEDLMRANIAFGIKFENKLSNIPEIHDND